MTEGNLISPERLAAAKARVALSSLIGRSVKLTKRGVEHVGQCPFHDDRTPSFVVIDGKGFYHCFGCGVHGDAVAWLMARNGMTFPDAVAALDGGVIPTPAETARIERERTEREIAEAERKLSYRELARALWAEALPIAGTPGEAYLRGRGITCPLPRSLRYHPRVVSGSKAARLVLPAVVCAVQEPDGQIGAVHRIYLDPASVRRGVPAKADIETGKALLGSAKGGAIRFAAAREDMSTCEGVETGLSVLSRVPDLAMWSGIDTNHMAQVVWPAATKSLLVLQDRDRPVTKPGALFGKRPGQHFGRITAERFIAGDSLGAGERAAQRTARLAVPSGTKADFNDLLPVPF